MCKCWNQGWLLTYISSIRRFSTTFIWEKLWMKVTRLWIQVFPFNVQRGSKKRPWNFSDAHATHFVCLLTILWAWWNLFRGVPLFIPLILPLCGTYFTPLWITKRYGIGITQQVVFRNGTKNISYFISLHISVSGKIWNRNDFYDLLQILLYFV